MVRRIPLTRSSVSRSEETLSDGQLAQVTGYRVDAGHLRRWFAPYLTGSHPTVHRVQQRNPCTGLQALLKAASLVQRYGAPGQRPKRISR